MDWKNDHPRCSSVQDLEARIFELKRQSKQDSVDLARLQTGVLLRDDQVCASPNELCIEYMDMYECTCLLFPHKRALYPW